MYGRKVQLRKNTPGSWLPILTHAMPAGIFEDAVGLGALQRYFKHDQGVMLTTRKYVNCDTNLSAENEAGRLGRRACESQVDKLSDAQ